MINREFWEDVQKAWVLDAPPEIKDVITGSGGKIDSSLLKDPWEIDFFDIDYNDAVDAIMNGREIKEVEALQKANEENIRPEPEPKKPKLDIEKFEQLVDSQNIDNFIEACRMLRKCELPEKMDDMYLTLISRLPVLRDTINQYQDIYVPDMFEFYDYYIPEALRVTSTYVDYVDAGISEEILNESEVEVIEALSKLVLAINEKIDEIFKFASIQVKAKAKALESVMSQNGFVDSNYKI